MFDKLPGTEIGSFSVSVDGREVSATAEDTVAAILLRTDPYISRTSPVGGGPRAPFCMMGVCFECLAMVDGIPSVQTCLTPARPGMRIERQLGSGR